MLKSHQIVIPYINLICMVFLCRRHIVFGAKIVDIMYDDRPKILYFTIKIGGINMVDNGLKLVENRRK